MAAVGAEDVAGWLVPSGAVSVFVVLLLLSVFLTALCSDCGRRSFELQHSEDKNPSALIRVVKLEEAMVARENPMIDEIQSDETEFHPAESNTVPFTPWRSHLGATENHQDVQTNGSAAATTTTSDPEPSGEPHSDEEDSPVPFTPWRSHLGAPQSHDPTSSAPPDHTYHSGDADVSSPPTNHEPGEERSGERGGRSVDFSDRNSVYAQVSKRERLATPPVHTPEDGQVEESSPPLPDRKSQLEG